jgi:hypothetical protein
MIPFFPTCQKTLPDEPETLPFHRDAVGSILTHDDPTSSPVPTVFLIFQHKTVPEADEGDQVERLLVVEQEYTTC